MGALDERADRCTRQEQDPGNREGGAGDQGAGAADEGPDHLVQHRPDVPARVGEQEEDPERRRGEAPAERVHLSEAAPAEHQQADDHEGRRDEVAGVADQRPQAVHDPAPRRASLPLEVDERREEQAGRDEAEADQLGMVVAALLGRAPTPLDARGHARSEGALLAAFRHARLLRRACVVPSTRAMGRWLRSRRADRLSGHHGAGGRVHRVRACAAAAAAVEPVEQELLARLPGQRAAVRGLLLASCLDPPGPRPGRSRLDGRLDRARRRGRGDIGARGSRLAGAASRSRARPCAERGPRFRLEEGRRS